ncbi:MAG TPA: radical SAM protein, partial [Candidatus Altiarchaeales archaeon]|nr:radical SAM protein [Candidatus Altiarchaeales archaeon]
NAEVIADFSGRCGEEYAGDGEELIFNLLERRPCTLQDISSALGLHENEVVKYLQILEKDGRVKAELLGGKRYFRGS